MIRPGDHITNRSGKIKTIHRVLSVDWSNGILYTLIVRGPKAGERARLTRPEHYKVVEFEEGRE